jgi:hypothetical protein
LQAPFLVARCDCRNLALSLSVASSINAILVRT